MIIGMYVAAEPLGRERGDDFVGVHVRRGPGLALDDVADELVVQCAVAHFLALDTRRTLSPTERLASQAWTTFGHDGLTEVVILGSVRSASAPTLVVEYGSIGSAMSPAPGCQGRKQ